MGFFSSSFLVLLTAVLVLYVPCLLKNRLPAKGEGFAAPGWRKVADVFRDLVDSGRERGGAFALYYQGELVVQFVGGYADEEAMIPWQKDSLTQVYSAAKGVVAIVVAMLVDRGLMDYDEPVSRYWPEFAANGKGDITVEQLLSHQAGLAALDEEFSVYRIMDNPDEVGHILANQKPLWTPGTAIGYHGLTLGLYIDQLVRRVDPLHRDFAQFFTEEVAHPYDLDFYIGLPYEESYRCTHAYDNLFTLDMLTATRYWESMWTYLTDANSLLVRSMKNPTEYMTADSLINNPYFRAVPNPSNHGFGTAVSFAKLFGVIANGQHGDEKMLLSPGATKKLQEALFTGKDLILHMNLTYGRGVLLRETPTGGLMFGTPGYGGQMGYADPDNKLGWAYLTNHLSLFAIGDDPRYLAMEKAIYEALESIKKENNKENRKR